MMPSWLVMSIVGSIVLTLLLNLLPTIFPKAARRARERLVERIQSANERDDAHEQRPRVRVIFNWTAMLIISVVLTILINLLEFIARG